MRKAHAFAVDAPLGKATYCGTPVTDKTVFAVRHVHVSCGRCLKKSRKAVKDATVTTTGGVAIIDPQLSIYT
jgi:hypothetical protein